MRKTAVTVLVLVFSVCTAVAQTTAPTAQGRWAVRVVPTEQSKADGAQEADHVLTFGPRQVTIEGPLGGALGPADYETLGPDFRFVLRHERLGMILWTGELDSDEIRGLIRWTRQDGKILTYRFAGERNSGQPEEEPQMNADVKGGRLRAELGSASFNRVFVTFVFIRGHHPRSSAFICGSDRAHLSRRILQHSSGRDGNREKFFRAPTGTSASPIGKCKFIL